MIIVKAPLRISIGGGGTDLPSYYSHYGSTFLSAAIDKYVYIAVHKVFGKEFIIKYSQTERVKEIEEIQHPIVREAMKLVGIDSFVEISSFADIPAGTGLGSSGTFTVSLLKALLTYQNKFHDNSMIAEMACDIEINRLKSPVGKQDQYISAVGGITRFEIDKAGAVSASPLKMEAHDFTDLEEHLLLFFTGFSRNASDVLKDQDDKTKKETAAGAAPSKEMIENLHFIRELGQSIQFSLERGDLNEFARLMNTHWEWKRKRSSGISKPEIDAWYDIAMANGALGGKLIGAGGGGFLMFLAEDKRRLRKAMREQGLTDVPFRFDKLGAQVVLRNE